MFVSEDAVLLPRPQHLTRLSGTHTLRPDCFIWLRGELPSSLLRTGRLIQQSLGACGPRWELTAAGGTDVRRIGAVVQVAPEHIRRPEAYQLTISAGQIGIAAHDAAGAFYAANTLKQIARQCAGESALPCLRIEDWPDFPHRGVMLDISRGKVPTMETLYALVDMLSEWKLNQLQLYLEHAFAYRDHPDVWREVSPMTGEEMLALDAYCRERFVELVPNQQSLGHLERWLVHPRYVHLAETPEGFDAPWGWFPTPFSLSPAEPGSLELLAGLYDELLPHFSSRQFNVGCDETFDLSLGKSRAVCQERGVGRVYLDFLLKIHALLRGKGRTMQFWGDIILHHPELIPELPDDAIALAWGYEAQHPYGEQCERFRQANIPFYVCPGTSSWDSIAGRTDNAIANIRSAAEQGLAHGAIGCLICDWEDGDGDDAQGHWQHLPMAFLGYTYGAAVSWALEANRNLDVPRALDLHAFQDAAGVMGRLVYDLGNAYQRPGVLLHNSSILFMLILQPDQPVGQGWTAGLTVDGLERTWQYVDRVMQPLFKARMARPDAGLVVAELRIAADLLRHACRLGIARLQTDGGAIAEIPATTRLSLADELTTILADYRTLWLARNRPGGLAESSRRMERLLAEYHPCEG